VLMVSISSIVFRGVLKCPECAYISNIFNIFGVMVQNQEVKVRWCLGVKIGVLLTECVACGNRLNDGRVERYSSS
jgi:hypothetical protein